MPAESGLGSVAQRVPRSRLLRRHLDDGTIRTRGGEDVSLDPDIIETDVASVLAAFVAEAARRCDRGFVR